MTATARQATARIITDTADLLDLALTAGFDDCDLCGLPAADLYDRLDDDGREVGACEHCTDTHGLGHAAD